MSAESVAAVLASSAVLAGASKWLGNKIVHLIRKQDRQELLLFGDGTDDNPGIRVFQERTDLRLGQMDNRTARIEAELFPNHGSSLRDAVDRIEKAVRAKP